MECSRARGTDQCGGRPRGGSSPFPRATSGKGFDTRRESGRTSRIDPSAYVAVTFQCSSLYPLSKRKSMFLRHDVLTQKSYDEIETKIETNKGALRKNEAGKSCTLSSTAAPTPFCQPVNFGIMTPQSDVSAGP